MPCRPGFHHIRIQGCWLNSGMKRNAGAPQFVCHTHAHPSSDRWTGAVTDTCLYSRVTFIKCQPINCMSHTNKLFVSNPLCAVNYQSNIAHKLELMLQISARIFSKLAYFDLKLLIVNMLRMYACIKSFRDGVRCILCC